MPGTAVPFRWITDLPPTAQKEIERDFLHLQGQINTGLTIFDAVINPTVNPSDPANHVYRNLTDLVANEVWAPGRTFHVGVYQPESTIIDEKQDSLSISGLGNLVLFGILPRSPVSGGWEWAMLTADATQTVVYHNLVISPSGTNF